MKLTDLSPRWCCSGGEGITRDGKPVPLREKIGLICDCPKCGDKHPMFVPFANPPDHGPPNDPSRPTWTLADPNCTFENMTLAPSILRKDCGWHGFITNGEVTGA